MTTALSPTQLEAKVLLAEAQRYLAAVDVFRDEGHEPRWAPELGSVATEPRRARRDATGLVAG